MADDEIEGEAIPARGADWEVVSLTESTYAAAPGPKGVDPNDEDGSRQEASSAMFMSGHFVFPPDEHENLPIVPDRSELHDVSDGKSIISAEEEGEEGQTKLDDDLQGTEFVDNGSTLSACKTGFEEGKGLQGSHSIPDPESTEIVDTCDPPNQDPNFPSENTKSTDEDNHDVSDHPCAAWWKKHASSLYHHAKEANTFWSIFVAAALTGLVILGKRWHRDKWHAHQLRQHLNINDEKIKGVMGPIGRLKNIIVGGRQPNPLIGGGVSATH